LKLTEQILTIIRTCNLNEKFNYYKHRISYLTGTCYNFKMEEFFSSFCVARVCQHQLGFLVPPGQLMENGMCIVECQPTTLSDF